MLIITPRKRPQDSHRTDDGGYLASASDLMIGLLFVFIIMVVLLALKVNEAVSDGKKRSDPLGDLVGSIGEAVQNTGVNVSIDRKRGVIRLPADILFDVGSAQLRPEGRISIIKLNQVLQNKLPCYLPEKRATQKDCRQNPSQANLETLFIEGHTDSKPLNRGVYNNWHLGLDRARAVYQLISEGEPGSYRNERDQPIFGFASYADERPLDIHNDDLNRRVELRFVLGYKHEIRDAASSTPP